MKKDWMIHEQLRKHTKYLSLGKIRLNPFLIGIMNFFTRISCLFIKRNPSISKKRYVIKGYLNRPLKCIVYSNKNIHEKQAVLIHFHGGGFFLRAGKNALHLASTYAKSANVKVVFVDYHLAPAFPYPYAIEDAYQSLLWVYQNADNLGIDRNKIIVSGDSAGGMIAATMPFLSQVRKGPRIGYQMLIYPVIDSRSNTLSMQEFDDSYVWNSSLNQQMWKIYLPKNKTEEVQYHQLLSLPLDHSFPKAYIEVHEYDCLRDEGIEYATRLQDHQVEVELKFVKGSFHGADIFYHTEFVKDLIESRVKAIQSFLVECEDK